MVESRTEVRLDIADKLSVQVLLEMTFNDRFIESIHPAEGNIVLYHSLPIPILMVHEAISADRKQVIYPPRY